MMTAEVGLPTSRAVIAFTEGRHDDVVDELWPIRAHFQQFGGSHAQRDLLQRTLTDSAIRSGQLDLARGTAQRAAHPARHEHLRLAPSGVGAPLGGRGRCGRGPSSAPEAPGDVRCGGPGPKARNHDQHDGSSLEALEMTGLALVSVGLWTLRVTAHGTRPEDSQEPRPQR